MIDEDVQNIQINNFVSIFNIIYIFNKYDLKNNSVF